MGRVYRSNATIQGGGSPLVRPVAYNCGLRAQCHRMLSTFKRHKQSRKSPKQLQNKQNIWRNKLEKVPRKGPEGKYGKSKAEKRSYYQNFKRQKRAEKSTKHTATADKFDAPKHLVPQLMSQERRNELATLGDEADILALHSRERCFGFGEPYDKAMTSVEEPRMEKKTQQGVDSFLHRGNFHVVF